MQRNPYLVPMDVLGLLPTIDHIIESNTYKSYLVSTFVSDEHDQSTGICTPTWVKCKMHKKDKLSIRKF